MKASELTAEDLARYLRIEPDDLDESERLMLKSFLNAARNYSVNYTGQSKEQLDKHEDIAVAVLCLAGDLYTNRDMYTQLKGTGNSIQNLTVRSILDMYCVNFIPGQNELLGEENDRCIS